MLSTLTGPALALAQYMSDISEDVMAAGWMTGCEFALWDAPSEWRETGYAYWRGCDLKGYMPRLDELQRAAAGWVWWLDAAGPTFVPGTRWLRVFAAAEDRAKTKAWWNSNEVLNVLVPEEPTDV